MKTNNGFSSWMEHGSHALDIEMQDALREPEEIAQQMQDMDLEDELAPRKRPKILALKKHGRWLTRRVYQVLAVTMCLGLILFMLVSVMQMPEFGDPDTLVHSELSRFYARHTLEEIGAANIISGIILSYRGFDTLGESHVLFIAVCTVMILLRSPNDSVAHQLDVKDLEEHRSEVRNDIILQTVARFAVPMVLVFGIYVVMNGHLSPGGGFSGGAILGTGLLLYLFAFGYRKIERFMTIKTFRIISCCALITYSILKAYHFYTGVNGLESIFEQGAYGTLFSAGMLPILDIAVGLVVACTMYAFYTLFRKGDF